MSVSERLGESDEADLLETIRANGEIDEGGDVLKADESETGVRSPLEAELRTLGMQVCSGSGYAKARRREILVALGRPTSAITSTTDTSGSGD